MMYSYPYHQNLHLSTIRCRNRLWSSSYCNCLRFSVIYLFEVHIFSLQLFLHTQTPSARFQVLSAVTMKSTVLWVVPPCSSERVRRFGWTYRLHLFTIEEWAKQETSRSSACHFLLLVSCLTCSFTLKMEAICSSETSGCLRTTRRCNLQDRTLLHAQCSPRRMRDQFAQQ
jgi:hypothetical protein